MKIYTNRIRVQATGEEYDVKDINFELKHVFPHDRSLEFPFDEVRFLTPHKVEHTIAIGDKINGEEVVGFDSDGVLTETGYYEVGKILSNHETGVVSKKEPPQTKEESVNTEIERIDVITNLTSEGKQFFPTYQNFEQIVEKLNQIIDYINNK